MYCYRENRDKGQQLPNYSTLLFHILFQQKVKTWFETLSIFIIGFGSMACVTRSQWNVSTLFLRMSTTHVEPAQ